MGNYFRTYDRRSSVRCYGSAEFKYKVIEIYLLETFWLRNVYAQYLHVAARGGIVRREFCSSMLLINTVPKVF